MSARHGRAVIAAFAGALLALSMPASVSSSARSGPGECPGQSRHTTVAGTFVATHHPLVLVHGWNSTSDAMYPVEEGLDERLPDTFDFRYFDYRAHGQDWAARPSIAACLADYVREVSSNHKAAGGDGKVFLVGHSMGGLAIRYASDGATVAHPVTASELAGVITIDTPHLGSVFGNTWQAQLVQWAKAHWPGNGLSPERTSDAAKCLALHDRDTDLPSGCGSVPYLPANTRLTLIAGTSTVRRTLFGVRLYDIPLSSDGVVGVESAHGYAHSGPVGIRAPRTVAELHTSTCTITSDETLELLRAAAKGKSLPGAIVNAEIEALGRLWRDGAILDALSAGKLTPDVEVLLGTALFFYPCGHNAMIGNGDALDDMASSLRGSLATLAPAIPTAAQLRNTTLPADSCGGRNYGWSSTVPIRIRNGFGEARDSRGKYAGATVDQARVVGYADFDHDGRRDALMSIHCYGSPRAMCCAGRTSNLTFAIALSFANGGRPSLLGAPIQGGKDYPGDQYGPAERGIRAIRLSGTDVVTTEYTIYDFQYTTAQLGHPPTSPVTATYRLRNGRWSTP